MNYVRKAAFILAPLDPVGQETYLKTLMLETGFPYDALKKQVENASGSGTSSGSGAVDSGKTAVQSPEKKLAGSALRKSGPTVSPEETAQEILLGLLATGQIPKDMVEEKDFEEDELKSLYAALVSGASPASLLDLAPDDETRSRYTRILMTPVAESTDQMISMATQCLGRIRKASCQKQYDTLQQQIQSMDPKDPSIPSLLMEAQEIQRKLDRMN